MLLLFGEREYETSKLESTIYMNLDKYLNMGHWHIVTNRNQVLKSYLHIFSLNTLHQNRLEKNQCDRGQLRTTVN